MYNMLNFVILIEMLVSYLLLQLENILPVMLLLIYSLWNMFFCCEPF